MISDRYGNGAEAYMRRALMLAKADCEAGRLTRSDLAKVRHALQSSIILYEIATKREQEKTPKA